MKVTISRKAHFNAAHRLHNSHWSDQKNTQIFGKCNNPNYHGHNYDLIVSVTGIIDPDTGYVMDAKILKDLIFIWAVALNSCTWLIVAKLKLFINV